MHTSKSVFVRMMLPLLCLGGALMPVSANAALTGVETILVKGYGQTPDTVDGLGVRVDNGFSYTEQLHPEYVSPGAGNSGNVPGYPEYGKSGGGRDLYEYLRGAPEEASQWPVRCKKECVLFTASTGDLVARVFLENVRAWSAEDGIDSMNIIATIDIVGAGGGTETANWWKLVGGPRGREFIQNTLRNLGIDMEAFPGADFVGDMAEALQPGKARTIATRFEEHRVPRFRISMRPDIAGYVPLPWIPVLNHDFLVPAHSTCGLSHPSQLLGSCSDNVGYSGVTHAFGFKLPHAGPKAMGRALWPFHYPIIMGSGLWNHGNGGSQTSQGHITYVEEKPEALGMGFNFDRFISTDVIYGIPYLQFYDCGWKWHGWIYLWECKSKLVKPIIYRKQTLNEGGSIVEVVGKAFFRPRPVHVEPIWWTKPFDFSKFKPKKS